MRPALLALLLLQLVVVVVAARALYLIQSLIHRREWPVPPWLGRKIRGKERAAAAATAGRESDATASCQKPGITINR